MKKLLVAPFVSLVTALILVGCTENQRARQFGGTMTVDLPKGKKLLNATWKQGDDLWYLVRPMRTNEFPERLEFVEDSGLGILHGKVIFQEH